MSDAERERWDRRYAEGGYTPREAPSAFLGRWVEHVPRGRALDLATGTGRNARLLAAQGFEVTAVDVSQVAIDRARASTSEQLPITWRVADLDDTALGGPWDLVTVVRYHDPSLWPRIVDVLAPGGWVLVEHHLRTPLDVGGPPDGFRLAPGELLEAFAALRIVAYEEVLEGSDHPASPGDRFVNARIAAVAGSPGW